MAEESKDCTECIEIDYFIDYTTYNCPCKNVIDLNDVIGLEKPKLNRANRLFSENLDCITYNLVSYDDFNNIIDMNMTKISTEELQKCSTDELTEKIKNVVISSER